MRIGPYKLKNNLFLAPMAGVTDRPFRALCRRLGAGMAASEMVASNSLLWGSKKTLRRADHAGEEETRAVQIVGSDPPMMAQAARLDVTNADGKAVGYEIRLVTSPEGRMSISFRAFRKLFCDASHWEFFAFFQLLTD